MHVPGCRPSALPLPVVPTEHESSPTPPSLRATPPESNAIQKGMRSFVERFTPEMAGELVTKVTTDKALPTGNRLIVQSHPSHVDALPSVAEGGQVIGYNFPPYHPFGLAIRSIGALRTGNGLAGTVDAASDYLTQGHNRKLWMAPMGKTHSEPMQSLAKAEKVPSGSAVIALKAGVPVVVEALDPVAAQKNGHRLLTIAAFAGVLGTIVGGTVALFAARKSNRPLPGWLVGMATALVSVPASIAASFVAGLKLAPAPQKLARVVADVITPAHIEDLTANNEDHRKAKDQLQKAIHAACDKATRQATIAGANLNEQSPVDINSSVLLTPPPSPC